IFARTDSATPIPMIGPGENGITLSTPIGAEGRCYSSLRRKHGVWPTELRPKGVHGEHVANVPPFPMAFRGNAGHRCRHGSETGTQSSVGPGRAVSAGPAGRAIAPVCDGGREEVGR